MPIQHKFCMLFSVIIFLWKHLNCLPNAFFYCNSQNLEDVSRAYAHRMMYSERSRLSIFIIGMEYFGGKTIKRRPHVFKSIGFETKFSKPR